MLYKEKKKLIIREINTLGMRSVPGLSSIEGTRVRETECPHFELRYRYFIFTFKVQRVR